ncbi:hypothetical protein FRB95_006805 [Tulasnella sp. JGI-2019a]|nr:hypothetical protein FRB95_006805 [Tulasnella sp. JGI-2019a]
MMHHASIDRISAATSNVVASSLTKRDRPSPQKIRTFSEDIFLVACGFRAGHLIDAIGIPVETLELLMNRLRKDNTLGFETVIFLSTYDHSQTFAVKLPTLRTAIGDKWTTFIPLSPKSRTGSDTFESAMPTSVEVAVAGLMSLEHPVLPVHCTLNKMDTGSLVALAGLLLEYPIAYLPIPTAIPDLQPAAVDDDSGSDFDVLLSGVEMQIFSCELNLSPTQAPHRFMKFSCPTATVQVIEARHGQSFTEQIIARWNDRLSLVPASGHISVRTQTGTFERLAL